jgi:hypothetical protein
MIAGAGHAPHREAADVTLESISGFVNRILTGHGEGALVDAA